MRFSWPWRSRQSLVKRKAGELAGHINRQIAAGSVDEGNATVFDPLIDAWVARQTTEESLPLEGRKSALEAKISQIDDRLVHIEARLAEEPAPRIEVRA